MAKKSDKQAKVGKTAKVAKVKLPKTIAGVKVPKELRKSGAKLLEKANTPLGREMIAGAAAALAGAVLSGRSKTVVAEVKKAGVKAGGEMDAATEAGRQFANAIGTLATEAMTKLFEKRTRH